MSVIPAERHPSASASVETVAVQTALQSAGVLNARVRVRGRPSGPVRLQIHLDVLAEWGFGESMIYGIH